MAPVAWAASSKYALFMHELSAGDAALDQLPRSTGKRQRTLEWVPIGQLLQHGFVRAQLHPFAASMVTQLRAELKRLACGAPAAPAADSRPRRRAEAAPDGAPEAELARLTLGASPPRIRGEWDVGVAPFVPQEPVAASTMHPTV